MVMHHNNYTNSALQFRYSQLVRAQNIPPLPSKHYYHAAKSSGYACDKPSYFSQLIFNQL
mgnify:FL=1